MIQINKKSECCGCKACKNICPKDCISMEIDEEGFWYPKVDNEICIGCNMCEKVCPILQIDKHTNTSKIDAYACKNKNEDVRVDSSSGGVFTKLSEYVISNGGLVFGVAYDNDLEVKHKSADKLEDIKQFRGAKYVQSDIGSTYKEAKKALDEEKWVLFSATPCQTFGLNNYLNKKYDKLISVDIACHGVPSPLVYKLYKQKLEKKYKSKLKDINFRSKSTGWKNYSVNFKFENGKIVNQYRIDNTYMNGYLKDLYLRPSCYDCKFKKPNRVSDFTLADYWGVQHKHKEFDDDKGVSLILVNSDKANKIFDEIKDNFDILKTDYDYALKANPSIIKPSTKNNDREVFFENINKMDIIKNIDKYSQDDLILRTKIKTARILNKIIKR